MVFMKNTSIMSTNCKEHCDFVDSMTWQTISKYSDMKTIQERAKEFGRSGDSLASFAGDLERGYLKGATDQKEIDIERMIAYVEDMPQDVSRQDIIDGIIRAMEGIAMATIEERAKLLSDMYEATYNEFGHGYKKGLYDGYIIGAHQQKKIDYWKSRKVFCDTCMGQCKDRSHCDTLQRFMNALEE